MRFRAIAFVLLALGGAAGAAWLLGGEAARYVERASRAQVVEGLAAAGETWAGLQTDGLIVRLDGAAPDEASRLRAIEIVRSVVDPRRVEDLTTLAAGAPAAPAPNFALELMRTGDEISAIGLAPAEAVPELQALATGGIDGPVIDMIETLDAPAPEGWQAALDFGLVVLGALPSARVSVSPGKVVASGIADSDAARVAAEARLRAALPSGVKLALEIDAPREAITPYRFELALDAGAARVLACSAETAADAAAMLGAAGAEADCALGPGAPSAEWPQAVAAGVAALRELGGGELAVEDERVALTPVQGAEAARVEAARAALAKALPAGFTLAADAAAAVGPDADDGADETVPPRFVAELAADGTVRLTGTAQDAASREAIGAVAAALFGKDRVENEMEVVARLPDGWSGRVLAGVEALALMKEGRLAVTPGDVEAEGWAAAPDGAARARALLAERAPGPARIALRFDAEAAEAEARAREIVEDPGGVCAADVGAALAATPIVFAPGSAELEPEGEEALVALAAVLAQCPPLDFEIAGHTDGAGDADRNRALSEARAETVKTALEAADLPQLRLSAHGYGAERPIADNDTPEGRAANRRIELTLLRPDPPAGVTPYEEPAVGPR